MAASDFNSIDSYTPPVFDTHYFAFIDILGFKFKSDEYIAGRFNLRDRFTRALDNCILLLGLGTHLIDADKLTVDLLSDSILLTMPSLNDDYDGYRLGLIIQACSLVSSSLGMDSLFVRGGISKGLHYQHLHRDRYNFLISKGLERAYLLESNKAVYPRILLDPTLTSIIPAEYQSAIFDDGDFKIVNFAKNMIDSTFSNIEAYYFEMVDIRKLRDCATDDKVHDKYQWILNYYYRYLEALGYTDLSRFSVFTASCKIKVDGVNSRCSVFN